MAGSDDGMLDLLFDQGLISLVRAGADLRICAVHGQAAADIPIDAGLCDAVPALHGLDAAVQALHERPGERLVLTNVSVIETDGSFERQDFVVLPDPATGGYLLSITPSLTNDVLNVELEQNLRKKLQLETRVAAQARAIDATNDALKRTNADLVNFTRMTSRRRCARSAILPKISARHWLKPKTKCSSSPLTSCVNSRFACRRW